MILASDFCIFCFKHRASAATTCSYGMGHEYPGVVTRVQAQPKRDSKLCVRCGLHPKNPAASTNGCVHEYAADGP